MATAGGETRPRDFAIRTDRAGAERLRGQRRLRPRLTIIPGTDPRSGSGPAVETCIQNGYRGHMPHRRPVCGWWVSATISAGPTRACATTAVLATSPVASGPSERPRRATTVDCQGTPTVPRALQPRRRPAGGFNAVNRDERHHECTCVTTAAMESFTLRVSTKFRAGSTRKVAQNGIASA